MATYAIGDVQGCFSSLQKLIDRIHFDPVKDTLWFVGDLVNRGPNSLAVLRFVKDLGSSAVTVLGNHDLHLLAVSEGCASLRREDTLQEILAAPDRDDLLWWIRRRHLLYRERNLVMVHAGLLPQWTVDQASSLAQEVEETLRGDDFRSFLRDLYKSDIRRWSDNLTGMERLIAITQAFTRLRVCSSNGHMALCFTGPPDQAPPGFLPWFQVPDRKSTDATIICGHWAALGLHIRPYLLALDSGCIWGRQLTAIRLEDREIVQISCADD